MGAFGPDDMVDLCKYGIGWETSIYELMTSRRKTYKHDEIL